MPGIFTLYISSNCIYYPNVFFKNYFPHVTSEESKIKGLSSLAVVTELVTGTTGI